MICPLITAGVVPQYKGLTPDQMKVQGQCRREECSWWVGETCAVTLLAGCLWRIQQLKEDET